ncbi:MAG: hypothetical protein V5A33_04825 [Halobacteriales archaeon]
MSSIPAPRAVRANSTRYGIATLLAGVVLLIGLRLWASPLTMRITGRGANGLVEFLMIPVSLGIVGIGILLFLWEPEVPEAG